MLKSTQYVPMFEEVCKVCVSYNLIMNIELKESPFIDEILDKVMAIAKKWDPESKLTRISSFDIPILHTVIKKYPEIHVGSLYNAGNFRFLLLNIILEFPIIELICIEQDSLFKRG